MRRWTTPEGIAFEGVQTGDGRIFSAGAFYWDDSPNGWPLRFDREDDGYHAGAVMIGAIDGLARGEAGDELTPITSQGWIDDEDNEDGADVVRMLDNEAPLGISVDMDDMAVEWVVSTEDVETEEVVIFGASFPTATLTLRRMAVAAGSSQTANVYELYAPGIGRLMRQVMEDLGGDHARRALRAAAGDGDLPEDDSVVLWSDSMDEIITRVTRARIRGATVLDIPAFDRAYIALEPADGDGETEGDGNDATMAALLASAIGASDLPIADRDRSWDGSGAHQRMQGDGDDVDTAMMRRGHFYLDDDADNTTAGAYHLPFADLIDGTLTAVPKGIFAVAGVLQGARGGANIPEADVDRIKSKVSAYYGRMRSKFDDDSIIPPWDDDSARADTARTDDGEGDRHGTPAVVAGSAPVRPPRAWTEQPDWQPGQVIETVDPETGRQLRGVPMEYRDSGEVLGHLALWGQCHTGSPDGQCILTPRSASGYVWFHHGTLEVDDGAQIPVGNLTMGDGHADGRLSYAGAVEHYDNAGRMVAQGRCGEDEYGVWFHGAGMPDVWADDLEMRRLRAASPSGDWRDRAGHLELTAALAVCHPGFPVPRAMVAASGEITSLVAAGAREVAMLRQSSTPSGARLVELIEQAVERGVASYVRQQEARASAPARRRLAQLRRQRDVARLRGKTRTSA